MWYTWSKIIEKEYKF